MLFCNGLKGRIDFGIGACIENLKLHADRACRLLHILQLPRRCRKVGVQEQTERRCPLDEFMQQAQSLGFQRTIDTAYPGDVSTGAAEACD